MAAKKYHVPRAAEAAASEMEVERECEAGRLDQDQEQPKNVQGKYVDLSELKLALPQSDRFARYRQVFGDDWLEDASSDDKDDEDNSNVEGKGRKMKGDKGTTNARNGPRKTGRQQQGRKDQTNVQDDPEEEDNVSDYENDENDDWKVFFEVDQANYFDDDSEAGLLQHPEAGYAPLVRY